MNTVKRIRIEVVQSFHDRGHYAEVWEIETGREVHSTEVFPSVQKAIAAAREWATDQGYEVA